MAYRRKLWIDWHVQGVLAGRIFIYWIAASLYFCTAVAVTQLCEHPQWTLAQHVRAGLTTVGPWIPSAILFLPLVLFDFLRLSHQFVGPVLRVRRQLCRLVKTPNCTPLLLRTDDYWQDMVEPVRELQNHILELQSELQKARQLLEANPLKPNPQPKPTIRPGSHRID